MRTTEIMRNTPVVYFISDGCEHTKIGVASDIKDRLNTLQVGCAYELKIKALIYTGTIDEAYDIEKEYHAALSESRIRGEWFCEKAVDNYLSTGNVQNDKRYMCDECDEFDIQDAGKLFVILLESKTEEEFLKKYENQMPEYWKKYDRKKNTQGVI